MKRFIWLTLLLIFCGIQSFAQQYPNNHIQSNSNTQETVGNNPFGGYKARSYQFGVTYPDTLSIPAFLATIPNVMVSVVDSVFKRDSLARRWVNLSTIGANAPPVCQGLIFGGVVTLNAFMTLNVTNAQYCINGTTYNSLSTTVTLSASDPSLPRKDRVVVNTSGNAVVLTGTPASSPVSPYVDPNTQILLADIDIPAGATTPANIVRIVIYNENAGQPTEWTPTSNLSAGTVNYGNTNNPYIGTIAADCSASIVGDLIFRKIDTIVISTQDVFQSFIRLKAALPTTSKIQAALTFGGVLSTGFVDFDSTNGFIRSVVNSYQNVSIPRAKFPISKDSADGAIIRITGANSGFYLDYIQLQSGIIPPIPDYNRTFWHNHKRDTADVVEMITDTFIYRHAGSAADLLLGMPTKPISFQGDVRDTINNAFINTIANLYTTTIRGNATPKYSLHLSLPTAGLDNSFNSDRTINWQNRFSFFYPLILRGDSTISYYSVNNNFDQHRFVNPVSPMAAGKFVVKAETLGGTGGLLSGPFASTGDQAFPVLNAYGYQGISVANSNPSNKAVADFGTNGTLPWGGVLFPRMTTVQRNGMFQRINVITMTNNGSGYIGVNPTPSATATSNANDKPARLRAIITGGQVSSVAIDYSGRGYSAAGSIIFSGGTGTGAAATYTVTTDSIPCGLVIYNLDSGKIQHYDCLTAAWINESGGATISGSTLQDVITAGHQLTGFDSIVGTGTNTRLFIDSMREIKLSAKRISTGSVNNIDLKDNGMTLQSLNTVTGATHSIELGTASVTFTALDTTIVVITNPPIQSAPIYVAAFNDITKTLVRVLFPSVGDSLANAYDSLADLKLRLDTAHRIVFKSSEFLFGHNGNIDTVYTTGTDNDIYTYLSGRRVASPLTVSGADVINSGYLTTSGINSTAPSGVNNFVTSDKFTTLGGDPASLTGIKIGRESSSDAIVINAVNGTTVHGTFSVGTFGSGQLEVGTNFDVNAGDPGGINNGVAMLVHNSTPGIELKGSAVQMSFYGAGAATFDASGNITSVSDTRLKNVLGYSHVGLNAIMKLKPIIYKWNGLGKEKHELDSTYVGFSAQNVKANITYGTGVNKDGYLSLQDRAVLAAVVVAIQDLNKKVDAQAKEIKSLKAKLKK